MLLTLKVALLWAVQLLALRDEMKCLWGCRLLVLRVILHRRMASVANGAHRKSMGSRGLRS